jgi:23S rRNA pseudouridine1911/1915/1917 synthase
LSALHIQAGPEDSGERLDRFLPGALEKEGQLVSRAELQRWIRDGSVLVNGNRVKPKHAVLEGERITVAEPLEVPLELQPEEIPLSILFEDEDIVVVDKQPGLVVHPGSGNAAGTLVNGLLFHCQGKLCDLAGEDRPGIVHRLDKDTSGCLVVAKSELAYHSLVAQFSGRETGKEYIAVGKGTPPNTEGTLVTQIGRNPNNRQKMAVVEAPSGKEAVTDYRVLRSDGQGAWTSYSCVIHTGRTHQIRVHLKECLRTPILGDVIYGSHGKEEVKVDRLMLHAWKLSIRHPLTAETLNLEAPLPDEFLAFLP